MLIYVAWNSWNAFATTENSRHFYRSETRVFACDFSPTAVDLVKQHPEYLKDNSRCSAFVCDITSSDDWVNNAPIEPKSLDAGVVNEFYILFSDTQETTARFAPIGKLMTPYRIPYGELKKR